MFPRGLFRAAAMVAAACVVVVLSACNGGPEGESPPIRLEPANVPPNVVSATGEVLAFRSAGRAGDKGVAIASVRRLQALVGGFERVHIYEIGPDGDVLVHQVVRPDGTGRVTFPANGDRLYLLYADLGALHSNSYGLLCRLREAQIADQFVPRICHLILCGADVFPANELGLRASLPGDSLDLPGLGGGPVGGLGGSGSICEQCLRPGGTGGFFPVDRCDDRVVLEPPPTITEDLIYVHQPFPFEAPSGNSQIYRMASDGGGTTNLSNNAHYEFSPDVHHQDGRIVFISTRPGGDRIHIMDRDGGNVTAVANTPGAGMPRWSRGPEPFIVHTYPANGVNSAIHMIQPDGSGAQQITHPGPDEADEMADVIDGKHIVFVRLNRAANFDRDLYIKYIWDDRPPVNLTNSPNTSETLPVVSHDGRLLAYRVFLGAGQDDQVHVAEFDTEGTLNVLHTVDLDLPADINISGIDFSNDDQWLYISTQASDVPGNLINRKQEIFAVRLDGTEQRRLTNNTDADTYPSALPPS
jgi:hypothetical protein